MKIKNSLSAQILKKIFIIYFSITFFITIGQVTIEFIQTKKNIQNELVSLEETFKDSLRDAIWDMNVAQIESISLSIYKLPFVKEITILDSAENIMIEHKSSKVDTTFSHKFNIFKTYDTKKVLIANIKISSDDYSVYERVKIGFILIIMNAAVKSFILVLLFSIVFRKYLLTPLNEFAQSISKIDFDNLDTNTLSIKVSKGNELDILQENFNTMITTILNQKNMILNIKEKYLQKLEDEVKNRTFELEMSNRELNRLATTDYLTGISNRRHFYNLSEKYFSTAKREATDFFILAIDIDNFKTINDTYGHQFGDKVLLSFTQNTQLNLRENDIFGRTGGEEFTITIMNSSLANVHQVAKRIVQSTSQLQIPHENTYINFTISLGIASIDRNDTNINTVIQKADTALYKAKENGKNRVIIYQ